MKKSNKKTNLTLPSKEEIFQKWKDAGLIPIDSILEDITLPNTISLTTKKSKKI